ncbi:MAG: SusC/RagA family TonB-linked outer membrane protein, partial [Gemmatimonadota bacterium]|nr:SusC/RagA family TonB-linked outer membrane protein [Gemmatimonadota bacterium]
MRRKLVFVLGLVACLVGARRAEAQTRTLAGRVIDRDSKQGVPGAVITVMGGSQGTQASHDGRFRFIVPSGTFNLSVRALGYAPVNIPVTAGDSTLTIPMVAEAIQLNQVVVTGAATTQERRNVATAVSTVSGQALSQVPAASVDQALQGKVLGTTINMYSGAPGGGGQIQIRGVTSILGNGQPLLVVDGTIISNVSLSSGLNAVTRAGGNAATSSQDNAVNRLADINPDEIENIQILKSAAATAIYGSEATNGVVIITTKRGQAGTPTFHLTQKFGNYTPIRLHGQRHFNQAQLTSVLGDAAAAAQYCPGSATSACPYYDNLKNLFSQKQLAYETDASVSGGNAATKYYAAAGDKYDPGTEVETGARRQDMRLNIDQALGEKWTTNASLAVYHSFTARGLSNNDNSFTSPLYGLAYTPPVVNLEAKDAAGHYIDNPILPMLFGQGSNPYQTLQGMSSNENVWRQLGSGTVKFAALTTDHQTLTLQGNGGFDTFGQDGQTYSPPYMEYERYDYPSTPGSTVQAQADSRYYNGTLSAVHVWTPGGGWFSRLSSATTSAGVQYDDRYLNAYTILARGLIPGVTDFTQGSPTLTQNKSDVRDLATFLSEEVLAFNEKLSMSGHVRAERSSVNGDPQKVFYYPAGAVSYRFTNPFPHADEIKLRAALGISGNQPGYGQRDLVISPSGIIGGQNALGVPGAVGNPKIRPEQMRELEYGVDATFYDQRVGLEGSIYRRDITDLLLTAPLANSTGYSSQFINGGHMQTKGVELGLTLLPVRRHDFTWTSLTTFFT